MAQLLRSVLALGALIVVAAGSADAGRVALVVGNGDYAVAGTLANPVNDAEDIAAKLRSIGFTVVDGYNLGKRELEQKIGEFADAPWKGRMQGFSTMPDTASRSMAGTSSCPPTHGSTFRPSSSSKRCPSMTFSTSWSSRPRRPS